MANHQQQIRARVFKAQEDTIVVKGVNQSENLNDKPELKAQYNGVNAQFLEPEYDQGGIWDAYEHSTILPQCVEAYGMNICGFGLEVQYINDVKSGEETPEMKTEFDLAGSVIAGLNIEDGTEAAIEDWRKEAEIFAISYLEVIRNAEGKVIGVEFINDTNSIRKTAPFGDVQEIDVYQEGKPLKKKKQFCMYRQMKACNTVYFKEFGDPRKLNKTTAQFDENATPTDQATEILEFKVGRKALWYGMPRWIGPLHNIIGMHKSEGLNLNYFKNGRHIPMAIIVENGSLTDESSKQIQEYLDGVKGEKAQHKILVLEVAPQEGMTGMDEKEKPSITIKDLAPLLQKDELFQEYIENGRKKVQSSFRLPDIYVGYSADYNRATAIEAIRLTEQQVFIPMRKTLSRIMNKLLGDYQFKHVRVAFKNPDITNPEDLELIMTAASNAGGVTPDDAREIWRSFIGKESEPLPDEMGKTPVALLRAQTTSALIGARTNPTPAGSTQPNTPTQGANDNSTDGQTVKAIKEAAGAELIAKEQETVAVMKDIRTLLKDLTKAGGTHA